MELTLLEWCCCLSLVARSYKRICCTNVFVVQVPLVARLYKCTEQLLKYSVLHYPLYKTCALSVFLASSVGAYQKYVFREWWCVPDWPTFLKQSGCCCQPTCTTQAKSLSFQERNRDMQLQLFKYNSECQAQSIG